MIVCTNHSFCSDSHCQCWQPDCTLGWAAVLWPMCFIRTADRHSLKTNGPTVTITINTYHECSSKENWMMNTVVYEMGNFYWHFPSKYLSFYCEFEVISNAGLKSRICSNRVQISYLSTENWFRMKLWNEVTPFATAKKIVPRSVYWRGIKSSSKFGLLPWKGNKSKWHSIQIFFNS